MSDAKAIAWNRTSQNSAANLNPSAVVHYTTDGRNWTKVADCEFGNIVNDPSPRLVRIAEPVSARYIRMDVKELAGKGLGFQSKDILLEVF